MRVYTPKIPKQELIHGAYYAGRCRNASTARWNAETNLFYHWSYDLGGRFVDTISCPEDELEYDVFVTDELLEYPREEIPFD